MISGFQERYAEAAKLCEIPSQIHGGKLQSQGEDMKPDESEGRGSLFLFQFVEK